MVLLIAPALATSEIITGALMGLGGGIGSTALSANPLTYTLVTRCHLGGGRRNKWIIIFLFFNRSSIFVEQAGGIRPGSCFGRIISERAE